MRIIRDANLLGDMEEVEQEVLGREELSERHGD